MPKIAALGSLSSRGFGEFAQSQSQAKYIENYFSTYLYTGNGGTQVINNGVSIANTAGWSNITSTLDAGYINTVYVNANGIYYAGANGTGVSSVIGVNPTTGATLFNRNLSGTGGNDFYRAISGDSLGNIVCVGRIANGLNASIVKYNSSGTLQWQRQIAGGGNTAAATCVACDSSNNIYVGGNYTTSYSRGLVAKYNASGTIQWQILVYDTGSTNGTTLNAITVGSAGDVYICGSYYDAGAYTYAFVAKINSSGVLQWSRSLKVTADTFTSIAVDSSDNVFVCGSFNFSSYGIVAKYNSSGTLQWQRRPTGNAQTYDCAIDSAGNVFVNILNLNLAKIDTAGSLLYTTAVKPSSGFLYDIQVFGGNVYASCPTAQGTAIIASDNSLISGKAGNVAVYPTTTTITTSTATSATATIAVTTSSLTESALSQTDSAGSLTSAIYTQPTVTGSGGLVWMKCRNAAQDNALYDTARGATFDLTSSSTAAQTTQSTGLTAFTASGFTLGGLAKVNTSTNTYASWSFRKSEKFFDIVTYTGDGTGSKIINHNLGSVPGMIIIKRTDGVTDWCVYHQSIGNTGAIFLNSNVARSNSVIYWNNTSPTSANFSVGSFSGVNANGGNYVAYLFANNAGGFGADGSQNVISCGSYTGNGSATGPVVTLGYEPQFVMIKASSFSGDWIFEDVMRNMNLSLGNVLSPNAITAETTVNPSIVPNASGFSINNGTDANFNTNGVTYVYMAIRRGDMKSPTTGTSVFSPVIFTGNATTRTLTYNFPVDIWLDVNRTGTSLSGYEWPLFDRLLSNNNAYATTLNTVWGGGWGTAYLNFDNSTGVTLGNSAGYLNASGQNFVAYGFKRANGFFDVVNYAGSGAAANITHNLGAAPELIFVKKYNGTAADWWVYLSSLGNTQYLVSNSAALPATSITAWNNTTPTSSNFTVGTAANVNASGSRYSAYLFGSVPGVSKIGTYTGTGASQTINCGFPNGVRFILVKSTSIAQAWFIFDTARGMVAGTDPYSYWNQSGAENNANTLYTTAGGFQLPGTGLNVLGATYVYLAIA